LTIRKNGHSPIDYIQFHIAAPAHYHRQATLYTARTETRRRKTHTYDQPMAYMTLSDRQANAFTVEDLSEDTFYIRIENEDNVPLTIDSLSFLQKPITRSEEHTSELQSRENLVCRLLLEKKKIA